MQNILNRRSVLASAMGAVAGAASLGTLAFAGAESTGPGEIPKDLVVTDPKLLKLYASVASAAAACSSAGDACIAHCQRELIAGKGKEFARCATTALQMTAMCGAVSKLAAYHAKPLTAILDACIAFCRSCEEACNEHKSHFAHGMHMECKDCLEACRKCREACEALKKAV